jgi:hypothetical protein
MIPIVKIYGLPRCGTVYTKMLIEQNFDVVVFDDILGWKHGPVREEIDWTAGDWVNPSLPRQNFEADKFLRKVSWMKDEIIRQFDEDEIIYIFCTKNPYSWYNSRVNARNESFHLLKLGYLKEWNEINKNYIDFCSNNVDRIYIVRFEDYYFGGWQNTLKNIQNKFELTSKNSYYTNIEQVVSKRTKFSDEGKFDIKKYENNFYMNNFHDTDLVCFKIALNHKVMEFLKYEVH